MSAHQTETYLRLLAEAELRQVPDLSGPGPHGHRVSLAGATLAAVRAVAPDVAWRTIADFQTAVALRSGDLPAALRSLHAPHWARPTVPPAGPPRAGAGPAAGGPAWAGPPGAGPVQASPAGASPGAVLTPTAIPIGVTLPLPPEQEGWYGELQLLCLARTDAAVAITVATRWVGQTRRSATARPPHAPFHPVGARDDTGTGYPAVLWDRGVEDGRDWWDCHLGLSPAPPATARWLEIGPGANGRHVRVDLATPGGTLARVSARPIPPVSLAARMVDRVGEELLCQGLAGRVAGQPRSAQVALLMHDLIGSGALPADDPAIGRLAALGWRLGLELGPRVGRYLSAGRPAENALAQPLPPAWASLLIDGDARDGPEGVAAFAATLPEIDGARLALAGLRSDRDGATLHVMSSGWEPLGFGWLVHSSQPGSEPPDVALSWQARDSAGRWHLVKEVNWGSRQGMIQMQLTPPLHPAASSLEVIVTGTSREVRATVPLDWMSGTGR
jgi:hypothetical protein